MANSSSRRVRRNMRNDNEFRTTISSVADGTRPASAWGTSITPTQNAYPAYATVLAGASVTVDFYEITVEIGTIGISTAARDCTVMLGFDDVDVWEILAGPAGTHANGTSVVVRLPLGARAGTKISAKASVNSATLTAIRVAVTVRGNPTRPDLLRWGTRVKTYGIVAASSSGVPIVPGTAAEGASTPIGTVGVEAPFFWSFGYGCNNAAMASNALDVDLLVAGRVVVANSIVFTTATETILCAPVGRYAASVAGDAITAMAQCGPNAADTDNSIVAYGVY